MQNLTSFNMLIVSFLMYFYIKVHGLIEAHKIYIYEGTDFIQKAPRGAADISLRQALTVFSLTAMRRYGYRKLNADILSSAGHRIVKNIYCNSGYCFNNFATKAISIKTQAYKPNSFSYLCKNQFIMKDGKR